MIRVPVAHGEGNCSPMRRRSNAWRVRGAWLFRYVAPAMGRAGTSTAPPDRRRANERGLGLMPHPENHVEASVGPTDGRGLFAGLTQHFAKVA